MVAEITVAVITQVDHMTEEMEFLGMILHIMEDILRWWLHQIIILEGIM